VTAVIVTVRTEWHLGHTEFATPFAIEFWGFQMSALRLRVQNLPIHIPAGLSTFFARAALAGFAIWLLAIASHA
jgi:hypothetical protein